MMLFSQAKIKPLAAHTGLLSAFPSEHLLFSLRGGAGRLRMVWYRQPDHRFCHSEAQTALLLNNTPLLQIQSSGCPTCESLLAAGYGLPGDSRELAAAFEVLDQIKDDPEIDDLMAEILVNCERGDDPIRRIVDRHWD